MQVSIAELIAYRQSRDKLVERVAAFHVASEIGALNGYAYVTPFDQVHHMAFVYGDIGDGKGVLARLHRADVIGDVFGGAKTIRSALARFKSAGRGVIVYLRDGTAGVPVAEIPHEGDTGTEAVRSRQWREIGLGAQILKDLGISRSACSPPASALTLASAVSASRSSRPSRWKASVYVSVKCRSPSFSIDVVILSPAFSQTCLSFG